MKSYLNEPNQICTCKYCQKECKIKGFSTHLLKMHKIKFLDYVKENLSEFPNYKICPICNDNLTTGTACSRKCISIWKETAYKGRNIWNEMSEETKQNAKRKISEKASINQIGRNIWAEMSEETKANAKKMISEKTAVRVKGEGNPMYGKKHKDSTKELISNRHKGRRFTQEHLDNIFGKREITKPEKIVLELLQSENINFVFQHTLFTNKRCYIYDFFIPPKILIEVDGNYWHGHPESKNTPKNIVEIRENDKNKTDLAIRRNYNILRFWESEIKSDIETVKNKIMDEIVKCC